MTPQSSDFPSESLPARPSNPCPEDEGEWSDHTPPNSVATNSQDRDEDWERAWEEPWDSDTSTLSASSETNTLDGMDHLFIPTLQSPSGQPATATDNPSVASTEDEVSVIDQVHSVLDETLALIQEGRVPTRRQSACESNPSISSTNDGDSDGLTGQESTLALYRQINQTLNQTLALLDEIDEMVLIIEAREEVEEQPLHENPSN